MAPPSSHQPLTELALNTKKDQPEPSSPPPSLPSASPNSSPPVPERRVGEEGYGNRGKFLLYVISLIIIEKVAE